jgi:hypothetical protein
VIPVTRQIGIKEEVRNKDNHSTAKSIGSSRDIPITITTPPGTPIYPRSKMTSRVPNRNYKVHHSPKMEFLPKQQKIKKIKAP